MGKKCEGFEKEYVCIVWIGNIATSKMFKAWVGNVVTLSTKK